jgi:hypothetical protein
MTFYTYPHSFLLLMAGAEQLKKYVVNKHLTLECWIMPAGLVNRAAIEGPLGESVPPS